MIRPTLVSKSQLARFHTEAWVAQNGFCLACSSERLLATSANTPARDFVCQLCGHGYELKASSKTFGGKIVDGAYASMMRRIQDRSVSSFMLMRYDSNWNVGDLFLIHHSLITLHMIEERRPLASTARRAGWTGCNILLRNVPPEGRIPIIRNGTALSRTCARDQFTLAETLSNGSLESRGWTAALLTHLHLLPNANFSLAEAYRFVPNLKMLFPNNRHVKQKIRQQLQILRNAGIVTFRERGFYTLLTHDCLSRHKKNGSIA